MTGRPSLADRLALALLEHGPLPCERLARRVHARTSEVRRTLEADQRFQHSGYRRGSAWRLVLEPYENARDGLGRIDPAGARALEGLDVPERLRALERRVAELELRELAE